MDVCIVKYNAGNTQSVIYALRRLGIEPTVTDDASLLLQADRVIFPGVGHAGSAMQYLRQHGLDKVLPEIKRPFLGICLGMQLMCASSEESDEACLGIFGTRVLRFPEGKEKVPHMGWNNLQNTKSPYLSRVEEGSSVYFVHSYYAELCASTVAEAEYVLPFSACLEKDNFFACQFHPEKSGDIGHRILENFIGK